MSLDLYIISNEPIFKKGTGVFIRKNGQNVELKTIGEVKEHFPEADISHISEYQYEDNYFWSGNITHNMTRMADHVPIQGTDLTLYDLLWAPNEKGFTLVGSPDYRGMVENGLLYLREHRSELLPLNPKNGWGNYEQLLGFTSDFLQHLLMAPDEYQIYASV